MINELQIRGARGMLGWSQDTLSTESGVSVPTIKRIEKIGVGKSSVETVNSIEAAFRSAGIKFLADDGDGPGVRFKPVPATE